MVALSNGNLDYVFLEEDEDMGVDGRERRSYANWANHTSNQSKVSAEIRRVGRRLLLVLVKALPPNGEILVFYGRGFFLPKLSGLPRASSITMIREAQFSVIEVLTGMSCPLHARGPPLSSKGADVIMGAMA